MNEMADTVRKGGGRAMGVGILTMTLGAIALAAPLVTGLSIALLVGFVVLVGGVVSLGLGVMMWRQFPLAGPWAVGVPLGIKLFFAGLMMITLGTTVRAPAKDAEA